MPVIGRSPSGRNRRAPGRIDVDDALRYGLRRRAYLARRDLEDLWALLSRLHAAGDGKECGPARELLTQITDTSEQTFATLLELLELLGPPRVIDHPAAPPGVPDGTRTPLGVSAVTAELGRRHAAAPVPSRAARERATTTL